MGLVIVITGLIPLIFGATVTRVSFPFSQATIMFQGIAIPVHQLITLIISTIIILSLFILLKYTKWGLGVRSVASNERVAGMMGINTSVINSMSWAIAGALGALSAITYTAAIGTMSVVTMTSIQINSFYASILGGFNSFAGPLGGAFLLSAGQAIFP